MENFLYSNTLTLTSARLKAQPHKTRRTSESVQIHADKDKVSSLSTLSGPLFVTHLSTQTPKGAEQEEGGSVAVGVCSVATTCFSLSPPPAAQAPSSDTSQTCPWPYPEVSYPPLCLNVLFPQTCPNTVSGKSFDVPYGQDYSLSPGPCST